MYRLVVCGLNRVVQLFEGVMTDVVDVECCEDLFEFNVLFV